MIAQHSSESNEHYTPELIVTPSRNTLGAIDLDPATCDLAQQLVQARCWYDTEGLYAGWRVGAPDTTHPNKARVFLNPPGGKLDRATLLPLPRNADGVQGGPGVSSAATWWAKLWHEWHNVGSVHSAIFVCFSMAIFRTAQEFAPEVPAPFEFPFCVPRDRINYDKAAELKHPVVPDMVYLERVASKGAPADSAIVYLPPKWQDSMADYELGLARFGEQFSPLGRVRL